MHPHLQEVFAALDASRHALRSAVATVPADAHARKPAPDRWSVNEVLEHLALAETRFAALVANALDAALAGGLGPESSPRVPLDAVLRHRVVDRSQRRQAPEGTHPTGRMSSAEVWAALEAAHETFRQALRAGDGRALGAVTAEHQRWGALTCYQWAELVAAHAERHAEQIREIARE